jgi:hypothetical protein
MHDRGFFTFKNFVTAAGCKSCQMGTLVFSNSQIHLYSIPCTIDVLWGQPIKLIQVASNSELCENQWNDLLFFEIVTLIALGPQKYKHKKVISTLLFNIQKS